MIRKILEEICTTSAGMMGTEPINLAGKEMPSKYEKQGKPRQKKAQLGYRYMKIRSKKDNTMISEALKEEIIQMVESILEGRLYDEEKGQRTDAAYELRDKMVDKMKDQKATASSIRKHAEKEAVKAGKEAKEIEKNELPKAEHKAQIAGGDFANNSAHYAHYLDKYGKHNPVTKRALEGVKYFKKEHANAVKELNKVKGKMYGKEAERNDNLSKARQLKGEARDLADNIRIQKR